MNFREWSYWVKGGHITLIIFALLAFASFGIFGGKFPPIIPLVIVLPLFFVPGLPDLLLENNGQWGPSGPTLLGWIFLIFFWFLVGTFFGWLYGKIKSKRARS